jgi:hypothetical protein
LKLPQENTWQTLEDTGISSNVLNRTPVAEEIRTRTDKEDCIKLKSFCTAKETITSEKTGYEWEKIFATYLFDRGLISTIYKEPPKLNSKRTNNPISEQANELNSFQKKYKWPKST